MIQVKIAVNGAEKSSNMLTEPDYTAQDALGLAELVRSGHVKTEQLFETVIGPTEKLNPKLNAIITRMDDQASTDIGFLHADDANMPTSSGGAYL